MFSMDLPRKIKFSQFLCHFPHTIKHLIVPILQMKKLRHRDLFYKKIGIWELETRLRTWVPLFLVKKSIRWATFLPIVDNLHSCYTMSVGVLFFISLHAICPVSEKTRSYLNIPLHWSLSFLPSTNGLQNRMALKLQFT